MGMAMIAWSGCDQADGTDTSGATAGRLPEVSDRFDRHDRSSCSRDGLHAFHVTEKWRLRKTPTRDSLV
jgi:hypothetical protein